MYSHPPKDHKTIKASEFKPVERELVFDVDLDDYKHVGAANADISRGMGKECWYFMAATIKVVDTLLREDFGFKHLLWIYSGRRGVHCWVCDERARKLDNASREAIVKYLSVVEESSQSKNFVQLTDPLHPSLERVFPALEKIFLENVIGEGAHSRRLLSNDNEEGWNEILARIPNEEVAARIRNHWHRNNQIGALRRWSQLKKTCEDEAQKMRRNAKFKDMHSLQSASKAIVFYFTYPRLDVEVSKKRNHLLKSPWCVHPKTGRVCVPIDPNTVDSFDPHTVPTLLTLEDELDSFKQPGTDDDDAEARKRQRISDLDRTSLKPYMRFFEEKFIGPLRAEIQRGRKDRSQKLAAVTNDW